MCFWYMNLCILNFGFQPLGWGETPFIGGIGIHCEFSILEHTLVDSKDLSLSEFISESNMSYFYVYLYALNKDDSKDVQRPISQKSGKD